MATRKQVSDTVKQRFQYHRLWGTKSHDWNNHAPQGLYYAGTGDYSADHPEEGIASGHDAPTGIWTVAWFLDCTAEMWAAINEDDPDDLNVYIEVRITCKHNKMWTSVDDPVNGFIDIGGIYLEPDSAPNIWTHSGASSVYLGNKPLSIKQLEDDIGVTKGAWIGGVICDTHDRDGQVVKPTPPKRSSDLVVPDGYDDYSNWTYTHELVFGPEDYDHDGHMEIDSITLPFYVALRWWDAETVVKVSLEKLFDFDIIGDNPFQYVPWAILKNSNWRSCDNHKTNNVKDGLMVMKSNSWSHLIVNNPLNPKVPGDSNGFRVVDQTKTGLKKWGVSPKTPSDS